MTDAPQRQAVWPAPIWRSLIWLGFLLAWTLALLTPQPVQIADEMLPEGAQFPAAKSLHVVAYFALTVLTGWLCVSRGVRRVLLLLPTLHACATEFFQQFVPLRTGSAMDVAIDHIGIVLGLTVSWKWWREVFADPPSLER